MSDTPLLLPAGNETPKPRLKTLANGAVYDLDRKRIASNPPGGTTNAITQAQAGAMANLRWERARREWINGGKVAIKHINGKNMPVWAAIGANIATIAATKQGREAVEAARLFGQNAGWTAGADSTPGTQITNNILAIDGSSLDRLLGLLGENDG